MSDSLQRILYLEDDPGIAAIAKLSLKKLSGFEVLHCSKGQDAVDQYKAFEPDLLLFDVMLPDMDGMQTLAAVRELEDSHQTPVIFMTAKAQVHEQKQYMDLGAIGVIVKPFDAYDLGRTIEDLWDAEFEKQAPSAAKQ